LEIWHCLLDDLMWNDPETRRTGPLIKSSSREDRVITLTDLIGFSDLTEAEVQAIVRHEHVTPLEAVFLGGQLRQSPTGQTRIHACLQAELNAARRRRDAQQVSEIETALARCRRRQTALHANGPWPSPSWKKR
jgi:hypothetical protein